MEGKKQGLDDYDVFMKVVLVGNSGVGKTNIMTRIIRNEFYPNIKSTIGVEFASKTITIDEKVVRVQLWDTAGQERYHALAKPYYRGASGALVVYDVTQQDSFEGVKRWLGLLREHAGPDLIIMLVGNKTDLNHLRVISIEAGRRLAEKEGLLFMETSAADGSNVEQAFMQEVHKIFGSMHSRSRLQSEERRGPPAGIPLHIRRKESNRESRCCG